MKIGILTWFWSMNYGGVLQALALRETIAKLGYDVECVHYKPQQSDLSVFSAFIPPYGFPKTIKGKVLTVIYVFCACFINGFLFQRIKRSWRSRQFIKKYLRYSKKIYSNYQSLCSPNLPYDAIVVGSDQVWNPNVLDTEASYLLEKLPQRVKRVAYAPSVAVSKIEEHRDDFARALPLYSAISLRERQTLEDIQMMAQKSVEWVVDPSQLLSTMEWTSLLELPQHDRGEHLFVYWLSSLQEHIDEFYQLACKLNVQCYLYMGENSCMTKGFRLHAILQHLRLRLKMRKMSSRIKVCKGADARDFLISLKTAKYVLSDSYHALMFSTIFQKNAKIYIPRERLSMASRILDFLEKTEIKNVVINTISSEIYDEPSGCLHIGRSKLPLWRVQSKDWLISALRALNLV